MPSDSKDLTLTQIEEMRTGARNAVRNCMAVTADDRVFILTDQTTNLIGRVLCDAALETGAQASIRYLEEYVPRPVTATPHGLKADLTAFRPTVTFYSASSQTGEVSFRLELRTFLTGELHARHAHMPGITHRLMVEGMRTDYQTIAAITQRVYDLTRAAHSIYVTTPDGTDLTATFDPRLRWVPSTGIYSLPGQWGNLPDGETFTCPHTVDGTIVVHLLGDYFSSKYGVLEQPVAIEIRDGLATAIRSNDPAIASELTDYLDSAPNGRRVGEFAIGTNVGLTHLSGNLLQDEKLPGLHVAFGNPYPHETGADWSSTVHVDVVATHCTIAIDNRTLMRDGQFDHGLLNLSGPVPG